MSNATKPAWLVGGLISVAVAILTLRNANHELASSDSDFAARLRNAEARDGTAESKGRASATKAVADTGGKPAAAVHKTEFDANRQKGPIAPEPINDIFSGDAFKMEQLQNRGSSTPAAAAETYLWAAREGDVKTLAELMTFYRWIERTSGLKPDVILQTTDDFGEVSTFRFQNARAFGPDALLFTLDVVMKDGFQRVETFLLKKKGNSWVRDLWLDLKQYPPGFQPRSNPP